jgi:hypothetical protein
MLRSLYRCAVRLHPPAFRERFAEEMFSIFDHAKGTPAALRLFLDVLLSLSRQWTLRSEFWHDAPSAAAPQAISDGIPSFYTISPFRPRGAAFINGLVLSLALFCVTCFAIRYSWIHVLHVRIPEVQFERSSWIPPSHVPSAMSQSVPSLPIAPQRVDTTQTAAVSAPAVPPAPRPAATAEKRRRIGRLEETIPAKPASRPQTANQTSRAHAEIEPAPDIYEGSYAVDAPVKLTIVITTDRDDGSLMMIRSGQPGLRLIPLSETKFAVQGINNCWIEFVPSDTAPGSPMRQLQFSCNGKRYLARRR